MSESISQGIKTSFAKGERATSVTILDQIPIGQGHYGNVYAADVLVEGRNRRFAIKRYKHDPSNGLNAPKNAARAVENYQIAKKAGLKVFTTYRLGEDGRSILMTDGNLGSRVCVDSDPRGSLPAQKKPKLVDVADKIEKLTQTVLEQCKIAIENNIGFISDAFFYLVDENTKDIDLVFGDFDIFDSYTPEELNEGREMNLKSAQRSLTRFIKYNIQNPERYEDRVNDIFHDELGDQDTDSQEGFESE